jgi:2-phosphoglycerate kinase
MLSVFIYGVPGAGKTAFSCALARGSGTPLVEADGLREKISHDKNSDDPFVRIGTSEAFREFGTLSLENTLKGLHAVRKSMAPYVKTEIEHRPTPIIMEGAFLDPASLPVKSLRVFLATSDISRHRVQYFSHRDETPETLEAFTAARIIQEYLAKESKDLPVIAIENDREADQLAEEFISHYLR